MERQPFPAFLVVLIIVIAVINVLAVKFFWYWRVPWLDIPMHFAGGIWLAGVALWYRFFSGKYPRANRSPKYIFLWAFIATFCFGLMWEAYQAFMGIFVHRPPFSMAGLVKDIGFDILGGFVVALAVYFRVYYGKPREQ